MLYRRLVGNYEFPSASSQAMTHLALINNLTKRITDEPANLAGHLLGT